MIQNKELIPSYFELKETPSTNQYCKERLNALPNGAVVYTFSQTNGRGSKGRSWSSEPFKSLALSILLKNPPDKVLSPLPLIMGLSATLAFEKLGFKVNLKWPNDLLIDGKKVAGLLCEGEFFGETRSIVCGIGVNLLQTKEDFKRENLPFAGSIYSQTEKILSVDDWISCFSTIFLENYLKLCIEGFSPFRKAYLSRCVTIGKEIFILHEGQKEKVEAVSVELDGRLLCKGSGKDFLIHQADEMVLSDYSKYKKGKLY